MPTFDINDFFLAHTPTLVARAVSSSEAASLKGKPAKTPIIAGSVCGSVIFIAWTIGFIIYFRKRRRRKIHDRLVAEGKAKPLEKDLKPPEEKIIIPPDPAVLAGIRRPGEHAFPERNSDYAKHSRRPSAQRSAPPTPPETAIEELVIVPSNK